MSVSLSICVQHSGLIFAGEGIAIIIVYGYGEEILSGFYRGSLSS